MTLDTRTRWLALYVLCLGSLMIVLDATIVNVALPSIQEDLGFSETSLAWVVNAYLLTYGGLLLLGGRLGDLYGHRRLFIYGITLFTLSSLLAASRARRASSSPRERSRGSAAPSRRRCRSSLIMILFTEVAERAKAMGFFGFVASGGGTLGVLLGGVLTDALSWHWIFLVNVPIGAAVCALCLRLLPAENTARRRADGRAGRGDGDRRPDGRRLRDRQRQRERMDVVRDARPARGRGRALGAVPGDRGARERPARPAAPVPAPQRGDRERGRRAVGGRDVRLVLPVGAVSASSCSATARSRSGWRSRRRRSSWARSRSGSPPSSSCATATGRRLRPV